MWARSFEMGLAASLINFTGTSDAVASESEFNSNATSFRLVGVTKKLLMVAGGRNFEQ